ncbi:MAG: hypothetical protein HFH69_13305 [Lachnospiraceae bacterium]|nr:hypothetical protein [Lachnospiraceae bacterium]
MSREREKEEKILQAIGDLPEDMVADAANYWLSEKKPWYIEKWLLAGKGFACAACAALVIFWVVPWAYRNYGGGNQMKTEQLLSEKKESGSVSNEESEFDCAADENKIGEIYLWSEAGNTMENTDTEKNVDRKKASGEKSKQEKDSTRKDKKIKEGKTVRLNVKSVPDGNLSGGNISVLPFRVGKKDDGITYTIRPEILKCSVFSVTGSVQDRKGDAKAVDCMGGDRIELNTLEQCEPGWERNPVPEWDGKKIIIVDIVHFTGEKEGEKYDFGRIVIGKKGGNYYGVYQKRNG